MPASTRTMTSCLQKQQLPRRLCHLAATCENTRGSSPHIFHHAIFNHSLQPLWGTSMSARVLDGKSLAQEFETQMQARVEKLKAATGTTPILATLLVGADPASATYVKMKGRSEEHTSELQSLMRISYAVLCLQKKN